MSWIGTLNTCMHKCTSQPPLGLVAQWHPSSLQPLHLVWIEGGRRESRVMQAKNKLILFQIYSTLLHSPSFPLNPKLTIKFGGFIPPITHQKKKRKKEKKNAHHSQVTTSMQQHIFSSVANFKGHDSSQYHVGVLPIQ